MLERTIIGKISVVNIGQNAVCAVPKHGAHQKNENAVWING